MTLAPQKDALFNSQEEFEAFYQKTSKRLWAYLYRLCGEAAMADDFLQESYLRFLNASSLKPDDNLRKAYLYRIATNLVTDHWRHYKGERNVLVSPPSTEEEERELEIPTDPNPDRNLIRKRDFFRVFQELRPMERSLLWLAYVEGAEHKEMAVTLGCREKSIRVMLFRARQKMAEMLRRSGLALEMRS